MAQRVQVAIDCDDPDRLAGFWALVLGYELGAGRLLACSTPLDECRLAAPDVAPSGNACLFHGELHYTKLDPGGG